MKAGSLILAAVLLLALAAPAVCAVALLLMFLLVAVANASCIWRGIRHKQHHSVVPLIGGLCGCFGLWLASTSDRLSGSQVASGAWLALPLLLDIGTPILLISMPSVILSEMREARSSHDA